MAAALALAGLSGLTGCGRAQPEPADTWGGFPSWLPSASRADNQVLPGSTTSPALTEQGDAIRAELPAGGSVLITITGPAILNQGLSGPGESATGTWTVTLSQATVVVGIDLADFAGWDSTGAIYHPQSAPDQPAPPDNLQPGQTVSFNLTATIAAGEGVMQWAPDGQHPVGTWDFVLEND